MRELALVLPTERLADQPHRHRQPAGHSHRGAPAIPLRASIPGPALELVGCASSQAAVAGFVQALKEIDGVTRVGVQSSALGTESEVQLGKQRLCLLPRQRRIELQLPAPAASLPGSRSSPPSTRLPSPSKRPARAGLRLHLRPASTTSTTSASPSSSSSSSNASSTTSSTPSSTTSSSESERERLR